MKFRPPFAATPLSYIDHVSPRTIQTCLQNDMLIRSVKVNQKYCSVLSQFINCKTPLEFCWCKNNALSPSAFEASSNTRGFCPDRLSYLNHTQMEKLTGFNLTVGIRKKSSTPSRLATSAKLQGPVVAFKAGNTGAAEPSPGLSAPVIPVPSAKRVLSDVPQKV